MARDIEEFLKMAAQRRQQQKQNAGGQVPQPARPQPAAPPAGQSPPAQQRPPIVQQPPQKKPPQKQATPPPQPVRQLSQQSVSDHVRQHIDTRDIVSHADRLGEVVGLADDKLDGRLHDVFDHSVATLKQDKQSGPGTSASSSRNTSKIAAELHAMLRSPSSVRQAIILSEILKRPDFD